MLTAYLILVLIEHIIPDLRLTTDIYTLIYFLNTVYAV